MILKNHTASGDSLLTHYSFDATKNKHDYYRCKDCMKNFYRDLRKHATKIISYEKTCPICKKELSTDDNDKKYHQVRSLSLYWKIQRCS